MELRRTFWRRPSHIEPGALAFPLPPRLVEQNAEVAVAVEFLARRRLFGDVYAQLQSNYFFEMPQGSGVFILPFFPTANLSPGATKPGDIDLLVVPYEGDQLVLHRTLALEVKVIRASFARPGRSPNEYGVSQARALRSLGFPFVGLIHLIVSDESPRDAWITLQAYEVLDRAGNLGPAMSRDVDGLPFVLIDRAFGRLRVVCPDEDIGIAAAFVRYADQAVAARYGAAAWSAECREGLLNSAVDTKLLERIADVFEAYPHWWFDTRRHA